CHRRPIHRRASKRTPIAEDRPSILQPFCSTRMKTAGARSVTQSSSTSGRLPMFGGSRWCFNTAMQHDVALSGHGIRLVPLSPVPAGSLFDFVDPAMGAGLGAEQRLRPEELAEP